MVRQKQSKEKDEEKGVCMITSKSEAVETDCKKPVGLYQSALKHSKTCSNQLYTVTICCCFHCHKPKIRNKWDHEGSLFRWPITNRLCWLRKGLRPTLGPVVGRFLKDHHDTRLCQTRWNSGEGQTNMADNQLCSDLTPLPVSQPLVFIGCWLSGLLTHRQAQRADCPTRIWVKSAVCPQVDS